VGATEPEAEDARRRPGQSALLVAAAGLIAASLGVAVAVAAQQGGVVEVAPSGPAGASPSTQMLVVEGAGAVARPGVYELPSGSRVADAIKAAGGYSPDVDPRAVEAQLNLAAKVQDGQLIKVPRRGGASPGPAAVGGGGRA
jgi:competence protein ComEA